MMNNLNAKAPYKVEPPDGEQWDQEEFYLGRKARLQNLKFNDPIGNPYIAKTFPYHGTYPNRWKYRSFIAGWTDTDQGVLAGDIIGPEKELNYLSDNIDNVGESFTDLAGVMGRRNMTLLEIEIERRKEAKRKGIIITIIVLVIGIIIGVCVTKALACDNQVDEKGVSVSSTITLEPVVGSAMEPELTGAFGVVEDNEIFRYARAAAIGPDQVYAFNITVYGPPMFPDTNYTARCIPHEGCLTVREALDWSYDLGLDGICAVSLVTPEVPGWYDRIRDPMPPIIQIEGHGVYLCVDRMNRRFTNRLDIYTYHAYPGGFYFSESDTNVWELNYEES